MCKIVAEPLSLNLILITQCPDVIHYEPESENLLLWPAWSPHPCHVFRTFLSFFLVIYGIDARELSYDPSLLQNNALILLVYI
jgi:hypothetical protein